jgi:hypothetical protein
VSASQTILCAEESLSYGALAARVSQFAAGLREASVRPGDRVGMLPALVLSFVCRTEHIQGLSHAEWPKTVMSRRQPKRRHLLPGQSDGPQVPAAPSRRALKTRKEAMSGISR